MNEELQAIVKILENAGQVGMQAYIVYTLATLTGLLIKFGIPAYTVLKIVGLAVVDEDKEV